jgi:hypothetical protein
MSGASVVIVGEIHGVETIAAGAGIRDLHVLQERFAAGMGVS